MADRGSLAAHAISVHRHLQAIHLRGEGLPAAARPSQSATRQDVLGMDAGDVHVVRLHGSADGGAYTIPGYAGVLRHRLPEILRRVLRLQDC